MRFSPRQRAIMLLARSLDWFDVSPTTSSGQIRRGAQDGFVPSKTVNCSNCGGAGKQRIRGFAEPCERCGGKWLEAGAYLGRHGFIVVTRRVLLPGSGKVVVDPYDLLLRPLMTATVQGRKEVKLVPCDACGATGSVSAGPWRGEHNRCECCFGSGHLELPYDRYRASHYTRPSSEAPELLAGDPVLAAMERREKIGSYDALGLALQALRIEHRNRFRLFVRIVMREERPAEELLQHEQAELGAALIYIDGLMPDPIMVPAAVRAAEARHHYQQRREAKETVAA